MKSDGGSAFPCQELNQQYANEQLDRGMSLRDWFAGNFMTGQIEYEGMEGNDPGPRSAWSYEYADSMIKERNKNNGK